MSNWMANLTNFIIFINCCIANCIYLALHRMQHTLKRYYVYIICICRLLQALTSPASWHKCVCVCVGKSSINWHESVQALSTQSMCNDLSSCTYTYWLQLGEWLTAAAATEDLQMFVILDFSIGYQRAPERKLLQSDDYHLSFLSEVTQSH